ncbi:MAG: universal stress protein, partial [Ktedonobacterales bacterium]
YDTPETEAMHRARTYLEKTARDVKADPLNRAVAVSWAIETDAEVVTGIERVAEQGAYGRADYFDFVAMATHGREGIARWLVGSVTEELAHAAHLPVMIVHPRHEPSASEDNGAVAEITGEALF